MKKQIVSLALLCAASAFGMHYSSLLLNTPITIRPYQEAEQFLASLSTPPGTRTAIAQQIEEINTLEKQDRWYLVHKDPNVTHQKISALLDAYKNLLALASNGIVDHQNELFSLVKKGHFALMAHCLNDEIEDQKIRGVIRIAEHNHELTAYYQEPGNLGEIMTRAGDPSLALVRLQNKQKEAIEAQNVEVVWDSMFEEAALQQQIKCAWAPALKDRRTLYEGSLAAIVDPMRKTSQVGRIIASIYLMDQRQQQRYTTMPQFAQSIVNAHVEKNNTYQCN